MQPREDLIGLDRPQQWDAALRGVPHGYWHTLPACTAASLSSGWPAFLYFWDSGASRVVCPLLRRPWLDVADMATPIGFSGFATSDGRLAADFPQRWSAFMRAQSIVCAYLALHPLYAPPWPGGGELPARSLYLIDLRQSPQAWLARVDANRRRSIRAWEKAGSPWVLDRAGLADFLVTHYPQFMRSVRASPASFHTEEGLRSFCVDPSAVFVGAADDDGICAVAVFGATPFGAELVFQVSVRGGRRFAAALTWWAVQHFHSRALPFLNLGGGMRSDDSLAAAKLRYSPEQRVFRTLKQVFDPALYRQLCARAGREAGDRDGYFPAYRAPTTSASHESVLPPEARIMKADEIDRGGNR